MFRTVPLSIIRSFSLYTQQWYISYRFADRLRACSQSVSKPGENVLTLLAGCQQTWTERPDPARRLSANLDRTSWSCSQAISKPGENVLTLLASCQQTSTERPDLARRLSANLERTSWSCSQAVSKPRQNVLILLASCQKTCMTYTVAVYSEKLLMRDRGTVRNT